MIKGLCIGTTAYDITLPLEGFPVENQKYEIKSICECGGGPAGNAAYLMALWGMEASFIGVIGSDRYGELLKSEYRAVGVDLSMSQPDDSAVTPYSIVLANQENGSRTLFNCKTPNSPVRVDWGKGDGFHVLLMDGHEHYASLDALRRLKDVPSVLDAGSVREATLDLGRKVDYLVCSEDYGRAVSGASALDHPEQWEKAYSKLEAINPNQVVMTLGEKGSVYRWEGRLYHQRAIAVTALDTTGAGDIYHGAFAYGVAKGMALPKCVQLATVAAGLSVRTLGGRVSIPCLEEVIAFIEGGGLPESERL